MNSYMYPELNGSQYDDDDYYYLDGVPPEIPRSPTESAIHYLYVIIFPYFLLHGTITNILSITLMSRYSRNIWSTCLYMTLLFPMELIKLYVECGNEWYKKINNERENLSADILLLSNAVCKVYSFAYSFLLHESSWLAVAVGIETTIATAHPFWIYSMCTRERATAVVLFISVLLISLNLHFFWTTGLTRPSDDPAITITLCNYINELSDQFRDYIWPLINFILGNVLPFLILIHCVGFVIPNCRRSRGKKTEEQDKFLEKYFLDIKTLHELKKSMFVIAISYTLYTLLCIMEMSFVYFVTNEKIDLTYDQIEVTKFLISTGIFFIMSHKFWIFFAFCSKFRHDVKVILSKLCSPFKRGYYKTHSTNKCALLEPNKDAASSWQESE